MNNNTASTGSNNPVVYSTTEIACAMAISMLTDSDISALKSDTNRFLTEKIGVNFGDKLEINFVDNSNEEIHLALPYYEFVADIASEEIDDSRIADISGGEIFISIGGAVGGIVGGLVVTNAILGYGITKAIATGAVVGAVIGGAVGAAATAGAITGTVIGVKQARGEK